MAKCRICGDKTGFGGSRISKLARDSYQQAEMLRGFAKLVEGAEDDESRKLVENATKTAQQCEEYGSELHFTCHNMGMPGPDYPAIGNWMRGVDQLLANLAREVQGVQGLGQA